MIVKLKRILYFPLASYFKLFAQIQLFFWKPRIIVITGSNSKTTLLHLMESQLGGLARYTHHANSSFGIPFDILGLKRKTLMSFEWPILFLMAPIKAFQTPPKTKIYIIEADCDRPGEGKFLANLLKPEITIWLSSSKTHTMNFPQPVEETVAFEFGYFLEKTRKVCIVNDDSKLIMHQLPRTNCKVRKLNKKGHLQSYKVLKSKTHFKIDGKLLKFNYLLPEDTFYSLMAVFEICRYLNIRLKKDFSDFKLPPGRSSLFEGIKNTTIIDSSYNATPASMEVVLDMFNKYPGGKKWIILGDMVELGQEEKEEHEKLAPVINELHLEKIILVGPRLSKYTYPKLKSKNIVEKYDGPKETLDYLKSNLRGGEVLLFKGARFLEGIIEHLLKNKNDINNLCRREKVWHERRRKWGL